MSECRMNCEDSHPFHGTPAVGTEIPLQFISVKVFIVWCSNIVTDSLKIITYLLKPTLWPRVNTKDIALRI